MHTLGNQKLCVLFTISSSAINTVPSAWQMCVCVYICIHTYISIHVHMNICIYACVYVYVYMICVYVYTHMLNKWVTRSNEKSWSYIKKICSKWRPAKKIVIMQIKLHWQLQIKKRELSPQKCRQSRDKKTKHIIYRILIIDNVFKGNLMFNINNSEKATIEY